MKILAIIFVIVETDQTIGSVRVANEENDAFY